MKTKTKNKKSVGLLEAINNETVVKNNFTTTENGALTHKTTLNSVLDFFSLGGAVRTRSEDDIIDLFSKAYNEDKLLALKTLFYLRDVRNGQGERDTPRKCLTWLSNIDKDVVVKNIKNIPEFGRWDDLFALDNTASETELYKFISKQLKQDLKSLKNGESVSLLAKWLPSISTSSKETRKLAKKVSSKLGLTHKEYRKTLSSLRSKIDIVETHLCEKEYSRIDYEKVPSKAGLLYRKAFSKNDANRYVKYLNDVKNGDKKINSSTLYPHDIVSAIANSQGNDNTSLELQWNSLPDYSDGKPQKVITLVDISGSMSTQISNNSRIRAVDVSVALGLYFSERIQGPFKDHFITFESNSRLVKVSGNISQRIDTTFRLGSDMGSTDLQRAFELILDSAVANNVSKEDMPDTILCISDMEFNQGTSGYTNHKQIKNKYAKAGYDMPRIVYWNVNARNNQSPVKKDTENTVLVSGYSPSILKTILSSKDHSPLDLMLEVLNKDRYDLVTV